MIAIIANPNALRFSLKKLKWIKEYLENEGFKVDTFFTQKAKDGTKIASKIAGIYRIIAAYGGDGIVNEVINADMKGSALAVLPSGTTNVLAIELFGKSSIDLALEALRKGKTKEAYVGKINNTFFILMAGIGFDGESVHNVDENLKKVSGKLAYIAAGVSAYFSYNQNCFELTVENKKYRTLWAVIAKAKKYAGDFDISPDVDIFSPYLDVFICECRNRMAALPYCNAALFGGFHKLNPPFVKHIKTQQPIKITGEPFIQIDGDFYTKGPGIVKLSKKIEIVAK